MKSFSSSVINKTGKKFAPKAPVRRAPAAAPARRPSAVQQAQVQAAQNETTQPDKQDGPDKREDVAGSAPAFEPGAPEAPAAADAKPQKVDAAPTEPPVAPSFTSPITKVDAPIETPTATPILTPVATQIADPTAVAVPKSTTSIPKPVAGSIPPPKRKASALETTHKPTAPLTPPPTQSSQPTPASTSTSVTQPESPRDEPEEALLEYARVEAARAAENLANTQPPLSSDQAQTEPQEKTAPTEIRPAKRRKSSVTTAVKPGRKKSVSTVNSASSSRRGSQSVVPTIEDPTGTPGASATSSTPEPSQAKTKKRKYSKAGTSDPEGSDKAKRIRKKREPTPEGAETVEILPNVVKMSELCKDLRTGKKSKRETELRKMDQAEEERKKAGTGTPAPGTPVKQNEPEKDNAERPLDWKPQSGPLMRIVNGEIVLDNTSLQVDRHADAARAAGDLEDVVESNLTRKVNQATYGKRSKTETWDEEMTDLFYRGLRMFGTDFMVISKMFPGRSRRQIKLKFNNEERRDPGRIKDTLLGPREHIDIATYSEMTNTTYDDPKVVQRELDDEKKRIEDQHAKEKQLQEEMLHNPTGTDAKDEKTEKLPAKKSRKKQAKDMGGGTEEVLGSIDDFPMA